MSEAEFYVNLVRSAIMTVIYFALAKVVQQRVVSPDAELAKRAFGVWWFLLALITGLGAFVSVISRFFTWTLSAYLVYLDFLILVIVVALAALLYYFVYLFTGKRTTWKWVAAIHAAVFLLLDYFIRAQEPYGLDDSSGTIEILYANDLSGSLFASLVALSILLPTLIGAIGYFSLIFKVDDRSSKFRIAAVAGAFIVWFGSNLVAGQALGIDESSWWQFVSAIIVLLASLSVYIAFRPPQWIKNKLGLAGYAETDQPEASE